MNALQPKEDTNALDAPGAGGLVLTCHAPELTFNVSVTEAPVVWSYVSTNDFKPVRYDPL